MSYITDELSAVEANREIFPECRYLSFYEQSKYITEYTQEELNSLLESIGDTELDYFRTNKDIISYDESALDALKSNIAYYLESIFAAHKGFYESAKEKFEELNEVMEPLECVKKEWILDESKVYGRTTNFYIVNPETYADNATRYLNKIASLGEDSKSISDFINNTNLSESISLAEDAVDARVFKQTGKSIKSTWNPLAENVVALRINSYIDNITKAELNTFSEATRFLEYVNESYTPAISDWVTTITEALSIMNESYAKVFDSLYHARHETANIKYNIAKAYFEQTENDGAEEANYDSEQIKNTPTQGKLESMEEIEIDGDPIEE